MHHSGMDIIPACMCVCRLNSVGMIRFYKLQLSSSVLSFYKWKKIQRRPAHWYGHLARYHSSQTFVCCLLYPILQSVIVHFPQLSIIPCMLTSAPVVSSPELFSVLEVLSSQDRPHCCSIPMTVGAMTLYYTSRYSLC